MLCSLKILIQVRLHNLSIGWFYIPLWRSVPTRQNRDEVSIVHDACFKQGFVLIHLSTLLAKLVHRDAFNNF